MTRHDWQKSSYCAQGNSCVHVADTPGAVHLTESGDPSGAIVTTTPTAFAALTHALKEGDVHARAAH
ncbi:DUF397 domain-containing protein [Streptomyces sp. NPDC051561]|uniref:DUF397 domain-containing protein n=1 Tax=Streptomyces sp. NPDC051561 TaxID=3365658 RepID=UPI0037903131